MRIQLQLRVVADDDSVISDDEILRLDKAGDQVEAIGLSLVEAKALLAGIQQGVVTAQAASFLARHRCCDRCGRGLLSKGPCRLQFRTAFGTIPLVSPRFHRCRCQPAAIRTFSPLTELFTEVAMLRYKTLIGRRLHARTLPTQKTEAKVACKVINIMTGLGMPVSCRVA